MVPTFWANMLIGAPDLGSAEWGHPDLFQFVPISPFSSDLFRFGVLVFGNLFRFVPICSVFFRFVPICFQNKSEQIRTNQGNPFLPTPFANPRVNFRPSFMFKNGHLTSGRFCPNFYLLLVSLESQRIAKSGVKKTLPFRFPLLKIVVLDWFMVISSHFLWSIWGPSRGWRISQVEKESAQQRQRDR